MRTVQLPAGTTATVTTTGGMIVNNVAGSVTYDGILRISGRLTYSPCQLVNIWLDRSGDAAALGLRGRVAALQHAAAIVQDGLDLRLPLAQITQQLTTRWSTTVAGIPAPTGPDRCTYDDSHTAILDEWAGTAGLTWTNDHA